MAPAWAPGRKADEVVLDGSPGSSESMHASELSREDDGDRVTRLANPHGVRACEFDCDGASREKKKKKQMADKEKQSAEPESIEEDNGQITKLMMSSFFIHPKSYTYTNLV